MPGGVRIPFDPIEDDIIVLNAPNGYAHTVRELHRAGFMHRRKDSVKRRRNVLMGGFSYQRARGDRRLVDKKWDKAMAREGRYRSVVDA